MKDLHFSLIAKQQKLSSEKMDPKTYHVYIVASRSLTLYIGITSNLMHRVHQHKIGAYEGFSKQYRCNRLVWFEPHSDPDIAISREKELKGWRREKKLALIATTNQTWLDLSETWYSAATKSVQKGVPPH